MGLALSIALGILGLGALVIFHELGHYLAARVLGMRVIQFSVGFGPKIVSLTKGGIEYNLAAIPFGGFVEVAGMGEQTKESENDPKAFHNRPLWARLLVVLAGPLFNYGLALILFASFFMSWSYQGLTPILTVQHVMSGSPADLAGIKSQDRILSVNGILEDQIGLLKAIQESGGNSLFLEVMRDQQLKQFEIAPQLSPDGTYRLGMSFIQKGIKPGTNWWLASFTQVVNQSLGMVEQLGKAIFSKSHTQLGGVVEITRQLSGAAATGVSDFLWLLASLSVALGLFNLFPIPPLDGSKLLFLSVEGVIRRPVPHKLQLVLHVAGLVLLLALMLILTILDILRIYQAG